MDDTDTVTMFSRLGKKINYQYICFSQQIRRNESAERSIEEAGDIP